MTASLADPSLKGLEVYPTRHLNLSHENIVVTARGYFGIGGRFEEQRERFNEVGPRFLNRRTLAGNVELRAQRDKTVVLAFDNRGQ